MHEGFDLTRFVTAQDADDTFGRALDELRRGRKRSHWMWFVFPQIAGLGQSVNSQRFALSSVREARAYLEHPVLGERLRTCAQAVVDASGLTPVQIFGSVDAMKLHSSMTLFHLAASNETVFSAVLDGCFAGELDPATIRLC